MMISSIYKGSGQDTLTIWIQVSVVVEKSQIKVGDVLISPYVDIIQLSSLP